MHLGDRHILPYPLNHRALGVALAQLLVCLDILLQHPHHIIIIPCIHQQGQVDKDQMDQGQDLIILWAALDHMHIQVMVSIIRLCITLLIIIQVYRHPMHNLIHQGQAVLHLLQIIRDQDIHLLMDMHQEDHLIHTHHMVHIRRNSIQDIHHNILHRRLLHQIMVDHLLDLQMDHRGVYLDPQVPIQIVVEVAVKGDLDRILRICLGT